MRKQDTRTTVDKEVQDEIANKLLTCDRAGIPGDTIPFNAVGKQGQISQTGGSGMISFSEAASVGAQWKTPRR